MANTNHKRGHKRGFVRAIKIVVLILALAGIATATALALMPKPVPIEVAELGRAPMQVTIDENGRTRVIDRYLVSAPLGGTLARINLAPGDPVEEGSHLAIIEAIEPPLLDARTRAEAEARLKAAEAARRQASAGVKRAKAATDFAASERDRIAKLVAKGSVPQRNLDLAELDHSTREQELESARFGVRVAKYELEMARATIARIEAHKGSKKGKRGGQDADAFEGPVVEVHSPIAGTVLKVIQEDEGVISPGTPLIELADQTALEIVVDVLTTDAVHIHHGDEVVIREWGGPDELQGRVRLVEPSAFTKLSALGVEEQRVNVIIDLTTYPTEEFALGDGYRVEVSIIVWESEDVLQLPVSALVRVGERWATWVVEGGLAHQREIEIGRRQGLVVEVVEGLEAGEVVIVHPSDAVAEGVEVEVHAES